MFSSLVQDGIFKIENYLDGETLNNLHDEVLDKCQNEAGHYEFGRNYRGEEISTFPEHSAISKVYNAEWMKSLYRKYTGAIKGQSSNNQYGMNVFATHDYKFEGELARNGWLHFDRHWRLKFFIYLTDVDESSGAFSCSVGSRPLGQRLRTNAWGAKDYEGVKNSRATTVDGDDSIIVRVTSPTVAVPIDATDSNLKVIEKTTGA